MQRYDGWPHKERAGLTPDHQPTKCTVVIQPIWSLARFSHTVYRNYLEWLDKYRCLRPSCRSLFQLVQNGALTPYFLFLGPNVILMCSWNWQQLAAREAMVNPCSMINYTWWHHISWKLWGLMVTSPHPAPGFSASVPLYLLFPPSTMTFSSLIIPYPNIKCHLCSNTSHSSASSHSELPLNFTWS